MIALIIIGWLLSGFLITAIVIKKEGDKYTVKDAILFSLLGGISFVSILIYLLHLKIKKTGILEKELFKRS